MTEDPKPGTWMFWTLLFAWLAVQASGSWWQVPVLALLAVSGGTWAQHNVLWEKRKAERAAAPGGYPPVPRPLPVPPQVPPPPMDRKLH